MSKQVRGQRVLIPEFELVSNPTIRIADVRQQRFHVIDRATQTMRQQIQAQEDESIFRALGYSPNWWIHSDPTVEETVPKPEVSPEDEFFGVGWSEEEV